MSLYTDPKMAMHPSAADSCILDTIFTLKHVEGLILVISHEGGVDDDGGEHNGSEPVTAFSISTQMGMPISVLTAPAKWGIR